MRQLSFEDSLRRLPKQKVGLKQSFLEFHAKNPWVYLKFLEHCRALKSRGYQHYSARTLIAVMRFEWDLRTTGDVVDIRGGQVKQVRLNDHHSPYYARMAAVHYPDFFKDFFEVRELDKADDGIYPPPPGVVG